MVRGLDTFRDWFEGYHGSHVIIGGTACNLVYARYGAPERATKDIDLVVLADAFDDGYYRRFVDFVREAGYEHRTRDGRYELYRFSKPKSDDFPAMVELLSRRPEVLAGIDGALGRFQTVDGRYSLSAILLDDDYYEMLGEGVEVIEGLPVLGLRHLPVFKMHAWANLMRERNSGSPVHAEEIRKHRSDVCRLCALITPGERVELKDAVREEVAGFCAAQPWDNNMLRMWRIPLDASGMRRHIEGIYL